MANELQLLDGDLLVTDLGDLAVDPDCCCPGLICAFEPFFITAIENCIVLPASVIDAATLITFLQSVSFDITLPDGWTGASCGGANDCPDTFDGSFPNVFNLTQGFQTAPSVISWIFEKDPWCPEDTSLSYIIEFWVTCVQRAGDATQACYLDARFSINSPIPARRAEYFWSRKIFGKLDLETITDLELPIFNPPHVHDPLATCQFGDGTGSVFTVNTAP